MATQADLDAVVEDADEFDPLAEDFSVEPDAEDEGIVDLPIVPEMPESVRENSVFDKSRFATPELAIEELLRRNPGRKPVFLKIVEACCGGKTTSEVAEVVASEQADNRSVYTPLSLCAILERAGALTSEVPETADEVHEADGVEYLEIKEAPDATWTSTDAGLTVLARHREGGALRELLSSETEAPYVSVYERVLSMCAEKPRKKPELDAAVDDDPLVQKPRRYSNHFIELLESREALEWRDGGWCATELGRRYLEEAGASAQA